VIEVYHLRIENVNTRAEAHILTFRFQPDDATRIAAAEAAWKAGVYDHVASIDAEADRLELAYQLTNNVDTSWSETPDPRVTVRAPLPVYQGATYGLRSTSMGDILMVDGRRWLVVAFGFEEV
jgi:hypothetical protein